MSTSPSTFTGASSFSADFQSVIDRSVAIRSLGLSSLGNEKNKLTAQSSAVSKLDTVFSNLQKDMFRRFLRQSATKEAILELLDEADAGK